MKKGAWMTNADYDVIQKMLCERFSSELHPLNLNELALFNSFMIK